MVIRGAAGIPSDNVVQIARASMYALAMAAGSCIPPPHDKLSSEMPAAPIF